ncbi:MAG TPA: hypothetical protein DCO83_03260 [Mucilaginibacter sp.]|jgi:hypothetical protein|nr:hypothetical protein [Mucilaginibacter sp.]
MNNNEKITPSNLPTRRKFVWRVGAFALVTGFAATVKFPFSSLKNVITGKPQIKAKTITMLTQDGKLVQVNEALINSCRRKVNKNELLTWIKK